MKIECKPWSTWYQETWTVFSQQPPTWILKTSWKTSTGSEPKSFPIPWSPRKKSLKSWIKMKATMSTSASIPSTSTILRVASKKVYKYSLMTKNGKMLRGSLTRIRLLTKAAEFLSQTPMKTQEPLSRESANHCPNQTQTTQAEETLSLLIKPLTSSSTHLLLRWSHTLSTINLSPWTHLIWPTTPFPSN